ncbi:MAG: hypothetical protein A3H96_16320 [Acidobacteria bacterium RIFCSPLOWO2_02_FULL_67_36]|nr:MAG: hypothetical protein A3H96_16320 [Acidobacteria bacterium RIFCSPLOWO2_02_FULL_67_36]OFW21281.1 MAG: hypothetical protein A3G21_11535 [Acidobacteria bacterium RIFCSPLOWO2_12_FULL_66_21]
MCTAWLLICLLPAAYCLLAPPTLYAQTPTLGELAKREAERRKAITTPAKVITGKDLPKAAKPVPPAAPPADQKTAEQKAADAQKAGEKPEEKDEAWWRARMTQAREELRRNQAFADALQSRINSLAADFASRDDPFQRAKIDDDRRKAIGELDRVTKEIEQTTKKIADIEEEARVAGVPPGWLR